MSTVDRLAAPALRLRYRVGRSLAKRKMARATNPILVYTIGKTGSTTIVRTLEAATGRPTWQLHRLQADAIDEREREVEQTRPRWASHHLWVSQHFRHRMPTPERPWDVITLTRDPLAQSVSAFFQSTVGGRNVVEEDPSKMLESYLSKAQYRAVGWFDSELGRFLGIDVYDHPFTRGEPLFIRTDSVRLLLMRLEDLDRVGPAALSVFTGVKIDAMEHANTGDKKPYADAYQRFRTHATLPREVVDAVYCSRYARHFYSEDEIARFRAAWKTTG